MGRLSIRSLIVLACLTVASSGFAKPPDHAPAHGYRAKKGEHRHHHEHRSSGGFEVVFDSERGISIAVGFPDVYFHAGSFYRLHDGKWQMSSRADGGWKGIKSAAAPEVVRKAHVHPGPAKHKPRKR